MPKKRNLQPALDACQNQLGLTFSVSDNLDTKALGILGFDLALLVYILQSNLAASPLLLGFSVLCLCGSLSFTIRVIWPKGYSGAIVDLHEYPEYLLYAEERLITQLLTDTGAAILANTTLNSKSRSNAYMLFH